MIIDRKGRIFGIVNVVDVVVIAILILAAFVAIKFIFFKPNYIQYKQVVVEVNFPKINLINLTHFSYGKNPLYLDDGELDKDSYLIIPSNIHAYCWNIKDRTEIAYYFNGYYSVLFEEISVNCTDDKSFSKIYVSNNSNTALPGRNPINCAENLKNDVGEVEKFYYFDKSYMEYIENLIDCFYDNKSVRLVYYPDSLSSSLNEPKLITCTYQEKKKVEARNFTSPVPNIQDYLCDINFTLKVKARIADGEPYYNEYAYHLSEGSYIGLNIISVPITYELGQRVQGGKILAAHEYLGDKGEW